MEAAAADKTPHPTLAKNTLLRLKVEPDRRPSLIFGAYNLDLAIEGVHIRIGRFSFGVLSRIKMLATKADTLPLYVGSFCECADAAIVVGGDHRNESIFNYTFSTGHIFKRFMDADAVQLSDVRPSSPIVIGDNVIVSQGAIVLGGADIGSGSVIAAGAVVTRPCAPFGIHGGAPARLLKERFPADRRELYENSRWLWVCAHALPQLPTALQRLESGTPFDLPTLSKKATVHLDANLKDGRLALSRVTGFSVAGEPVIHSGLSSYFAQAWSDQEIRWSPDIFHAYELV